MSAQVHERSRRHRLALWPAFEDEQFSIEPVADFPATAKQELRFRNSLRASIVETTRQANVSPATSCEQSAEVLDQNAALCSSLFIVTIQGRVGDSST